MWRSFLTRVVMYCMHEARPARFTGLLCALNIQRIHFEQYKVQANSHCDIIPREKPKIVAL